MNDVAELTCSPYLTRPLRTIAEAERDRAAKPALPANSNARMTAPTPPTKS